MPHIPKRKKKSSHLLHYNQSTTPALLHAQQERKTTTMMMMILPGIYLFVYVAFNGLRLKCFLWFLLGMDEEKRKAERNPFIQCVEIFFSRICDVSVISGWQLKEWRNNKMKFSSPSVVFLLLLLFFYIIPCVSYTFSLFNVSLLNLICIMKVLTFGRIAFRY